MPALRGSELLVLAWCAVALLVSMRRRVPSTARMRVVTGILGLGAVVRLVALLPDTGVAVAVRNLVPALYVLAAYRICGAFFLAPDTRLEAWLVEVDRRAMGAAHPEHWLRDQPWLLGLLEAAYLAVYAMLPLGAWSAWAAGGVDAVDQYWRVVFPAEATCYLALAWLPTRPPRTLEAWTTELRTRSALRGANEFVLARGSHLMNTIPSGHAAGAAAVAMALVGLGAPWAAVFGATAAAICVATVVGRYHFLVDTILGVGVAAAWWLAVHAWG
ncbi:phosphatase PAP2 family protein [Luteitalea sp. TBR-22]|uniref:phosphatase PAP2 family protein n=1 Tax=Luteitalea sp. TBR-22 TaxID=2802971 RepID=UPI001AF771DC|nr:phosphatase PAP2 family protein [Luteitalea sp. TBR-22]